MNPQDIHSWWCVGLDLDFSDSMFFLMVTHSYSVGIQSWVLLDFHQWTVSTGRSKLIKYSALLVRWCGGYLNKIQNIDMYILQGFRENCWKDSLYSYQCPVAVSVERYWILWQRKSLSLQCIMFCNTPEILLLEEVFKLERQWEKQYLRCDPQVISVVFS